MATRMPKRIDRTAVPPARTRTVSEIATIETSGPGALEGASAKKRTYHVILNASEGLRDSDLPAGTGFAVAHCLSAETSRLKQRSQVEYQECRTRYAGTSTSGSCAIGAIETAP